MKLLLFTAYINAGFAKKYSTVANTIYALSSGYGKCGVAVIRVSGPQTGIALKTLTKLKFLPEPRRANLKKIYDPITNDTIDRGLILWFPAPNSFTGEDCCEFQTHGSVAVISGIFKSLSSIPQLRPADPGEFTKRAFLNNKMDLTEVEGLADLLQAETELQRKQAYLQTEGALSKIYTNWRNILIKSLANIEAVLDFDETESLNEDILKELVLNVGNLQKDIEKHLVYGKQGEILRNGVKTVIVGETNVGKSSILNNLCQKPKAIVSPIEGTTRDLLETILDINGYPLIITDTAGLRQKTDDIIEKEGIQRAKTAITTADFILFVIDVNKVLNLTYSSDFVDKFFEQYLNNIQLDYNDILRKNYLIMFNKSDLLSKQNKGVLEKVLDNEKRAILFSCKTNNGRSYLLNKMTENLEIICGNPTREHPSMNQERHRNHLTLCAKYLNQFIIKTENSNSDLVLMAEDLRMAMRQLGKLTGQVTTEELLDVIFRDFCIGK